MRYVRMPCRVAEGKGKEESGGKSSKRTLLVKGRAPVDPECAHKVGSAHVFCEGNDVYDVMLNQVDSLPSSIGWVCVTLVLKPVIGSLLQTNVQSNNNKYYTTSYE